MLARIASTSGRLAASVLFLASVQAFAQFDDGARYAFVGSESEKAVFVRDILRNEKPILGHRKHSSSYEGGTTWRRGNVSNTLVRGVPEVTVRSPMA